MKRSDLYQYYTEYCEENDRQPHGKSVFFRMMKEKGFFIKRTSEGIYFENLCLKEDGFIEIGNMMEIPFEQIGLVTK